jgi:prepilin-type N-terminal cleavage/methylation domain-containing protein
MLHNKKGLTLIELIVVVSIMAIIMSIAIPMYNKYVQKANIEQEIKKIFTTLNQARIKAFTQKEECRIYWDSNPFTVLHATCGGDTTSITLKFKFQGNISSNAKYVSFSMDGTSNQNGSIYCSAKIKSKYSCIKISRNRIILGKWNGSLCEVE